MAYTEFRKSYGDFEIVIPAVDFSRLTTEEAKATTQAFQAYIEEPIGFVCHHLERNAYMASVHCIRDTNSVIDYHGIHRYIARQMQCDIPSFWPNNTAGQVLRQEWCKHMATEIKREFGL